MDKIFKEPGFPKNNGLRENFESFFPQGKMKILNIEDLPEEVLKFFEANSQKFLLPEDYLPGNFNKFMRVDYDNGDTSYIANQVKQYDSEDGAVEDLSYIIDLRDNKNIGHAELRYNFGRDNYFKNKPFVGYNATEDGYKNEGLGLRRLFLLHALSKSMYSCPLYSDTLISDQAKSLWEGLVKSGKAKKFLEGEHERYQMLD